MIKLASTENGIVKGLSGNNARVSVFKGIPFAAPPVGENRWREPQPAANWDGVRECFDFAPISIQDTPGLGTDVYCREWHVDPDISMDEDCLYLNIWTNAKSVDDNLPVLVWFFGGAFQWGYTPEMEFNGEQIAKRGVVVVSVNYRLGVFGFLAHPELTKTQPSYPTNFGNLDQLAGLKWVKRNIQAFGGNPDNIAIAGQSAGAGSVFSHLTSDMSIGLYNKAVLFSGLIRSPYFTDKVITPAPLNEAEKKGMSFFEFLGVSSIEEARKLDALYIRDKYAQYYSQFPFNSNPAFFTPCIDGHFLTGDPLDLILNGHYAHVPLLAGNTCDEFPSFIEAKDDDDFKSKAKEIFGDECDKFLSFEEANAHIGTQYAKAANIEYTAKCVLDSILENGYYYQFEPTIVGWDNPGAFHSVDLWFFFDNLAACWRPFTGRYYDLARQMCSYFCNFIKNGDPNGIDIDGKALETWEPYSLKDSKEMHFTDFGCVVKNTTTGYKEFMSDWIRSTHTKIKKQAFNPYLPSWEYIPDGEPYVFGNRVYIYGSHDSFNGHAFCLNDYVCWSAPVSNLGDWRYEGVIYTRLDDPENTKNRMCLYAPDITVGPDGRYYLYYVMDKINVVSVAVSDTPAGRFKFYGFVHYEDGVRLGEKQGDEPQFDPGVITIGDTTYLYTGFCGQGDKSRSGAQLTVLDKDMLTVKKAPVIIVPGSCYSEGTEYEGHAFFEAPSIRCFDNKYYFIYSSEVMHELCYAISDSPEGPFKYGGVIVSNCDIGIDSYKPADKAFAYGANNHGSLIQIGDKRYIFYHRQTNNSWYSRQGCAEEVHFNADGSINQAELTSCGLNGEPLSDALEYPAYIACNLMKPDTSMYIGDHNVPFITQEGKDGDKNDGYISDITDNTVIGFKYFNIKNVKGIDLTYRGYANGQFVIMTSPDGEELATLPIDFTTTWEHTTSDISVPNGVSALYIKYTGPGTTSLKSFRFIH